MKVKGELGCCREINTPLDAEDANYLDETDTVIVTLDWGD